MKSIDKPRSYCHNWRIGKDPIAIKLIFIGFANYAMNRPQLFTIKINRTAIINQIQLIWKPHKLL